MKFLEWLIYIILLPLWLVMGLSWGIWQGFEIGSDMVFGGIWDEDEKRGAEEI